MINEIIDKLHTINEETAAADVGSTGGTTMDNIQYLPGGFGVVKAALKGLSKTKSDWSVSIDKKPKKKRVSFEKQLSIDVANSHWDDFSNDFGGKVQAGMISLDGYLKEAMEDDLETLQVKSKSVLYNLVSSPACRKTEQCATAWSRVFNHFQTRTPDVAVSVFDKKKDTHRLIQTFMREYGGSRGALEIFIDGMEEETNINMFPLFSQYEYLYGQRIRSSYGGVKLIYNCFLDYMYHHQQSIYIEDSEIVDEIESDFPAMRASGNVIYPAGGVFNPSFFKSLKDYIVDRNV